MPSKYGIEFELTPEEGRAYLKTAEIKVEDVPAVPNWMGAYNRPRIKWQGEWIGLCRTDLKDDVATGLCATKTPEEWREYYLGRINIGVRIKPAQFAGGVIMHKDGTEEIVHDTALRFSCIDARSDG